MNNKKGGDRPSPSGFINIPRTPGITWPEAKPDEETDPPEDRDSGENKKPVQ